MGPSNPYAIAAADVDDDGDVDLLSANSTGFNVTVFRNDGAAGFTAGGIVAVPVPYSPQSLTVGDLDGDGDLDLVAGAYTSPGAVSGVGVLCVRFNNGSGVFSGTGNVAAPQPVHSLVLGDVDGDGDLDLLASLGGTAPAVQVRLNNGLGGFGAPTSLPMQSECLRLCLGDIDGDGDLDLLANTYNGGEVSIRFNNGSGVFSGTASIVTNTYNYALALADFDRDGDLDIALSSDNFRGVELYANNGQASFLLFARLATLGNQTSLTAADLNGDGAPDVLGTGSDKVESFLNNGTGGFGPRMNSSYVYFGPRDLAAADLDNDGDLDVALASTAGNRLSVRLNNGTGAPLAQLNPAPAAPFTISPVPAHPADDAVWVRQLPAGTRAVLVRDAMGRAVRTVPVAGTAVALPLAGLRPGLYLVQAGSATARLMVE
ncbi:VCBS repeat-containing protein [Hymenobacter sp. DH14]|uniref:VCBS repeat-containing protein n=2 Tax=Hymenobacter cyanobacteriorum TaxID=2926463 RepID=A0A9X1VGU7_9BACT|nr:VCBS repeat-containing protein [Hymenobacter cyanobacteriorum]MCI1187908.1 VCBS repeat-containing protein [Hymenobacter cyanobacteriorum]